MQASIAHSCLPPDAINKKWGNLDNFKAEFTKSALGNFGAGWTWLVRKKDGSVDIVNTSNAGTPATTSDKPLLVIDVRKVCWFLVLSPFSITGVGARVLH